jgi:uncharacterized protein (DUF433 family)
VPKKTLKNTNHASIVKPMDLCGGSPVVDGTRTHMIDIAIEDEILGYSPDEIIVSHPYLRLSKVHDATMMLSSP